jgi:heat shock protein HslJ
MNDGLFELALILVPLTAPPVSAFRQLKKCITFEREKMNTKKTIITFAIVSLLYVVPLTALAQEPPPAGLSVEDLGNATYHGIYDEPVTLTDGTFEGEPFEEGGASRPTVTLVDDPVGYGDVTGDGQTEAAVLLAESSGGSGTFIYLAVVTAEDDQPVNLATTLLGDRVQVNSIQIEDNQIVLDMLQVGPDDPFCCPSQHVVLTYQVEGDQLVEISSQELSLAGPIWRWDQTVMNNDEIVVPDDPASYTVQFTAEGGISVQADCNMINGTYTVEDSSLTITLGPSTLVACPEGSLGDTFASQLGAGAVYFFQDGKLFIDLFADSGTMQFSPQSTDLAGTSWLAIGYNNGRGGVVSPILETELTAHFGEDGVLTGSAGCNDYRAPYEVEDSAITIGPVATTRKACGEPEGVMVQEQEYLAALETTATYQIRGDKLEMRTAEGALTVNLMAMPAD